MESQPHRYRPICCTAERFLHPARGGYGQWAWARSTDGSDSHLQTSCACSEEICGVLLSSCGAGLDLRFCKHSFNETGQCLELDTVVHRESYVMALLILFGCCSTRQISEELCFVWFRCLYNSICSPMQVSDSSMASLDVFKIFNYRAIVIETQSPFKIHIKHRRPRWRIAVYRSFPLQHQQRQAVSALHHVPKDNFNLTHLSSTCNRHPFPSFLHPPSLVSSSFLPPTSSLLSTHP